MRPLQQFAQASRGRETESEGELQCAPRAARCARAARANTNSVACAAPEQNRLMPIPGHTQRRALSRTIKVPVDSILHWYSPIKIYFTSLAVNFSVTEWERVGGVAARGFSIFSLSLTHTVSQHTLRNVPRQAAPRVCMWSSLRRTHTNTATVRQRTDRHALCVQSKGAFATQPQLRRDASQMGLAP